MTTLKGIIVFALGGLFVYSLLRGRANRRNESLERAVAEARQRRMAEGNTRTDDPFETHRKRREERFQRKAITAAHRLSKPAA